MTQTKTDSTFNFNESEVREVIVPVVHGGGILFRVDENDRFMVCAVTPDDAPETETVPPVDGGPETAAAGGWVPPVVPPCAVCGTADDCFGETWDVLDIIAVEPRIVPVLIEAARFSTIAPDLREVLLTPLMERVEAYIGEGARYPLLRCDSAYACVEAYMREALGL